jgi:hypothetical protein
MGTGQETVLSSQSPSQLHLAKPSEKREEEQRVARRKRTRENLLLKLGRVRVQTPRPPINEREKKL